MKQILPLMLAIIGLGWLPQWANGAEPPSPEQQLTTTLKALHLPLVNLSGVDVPHAIAFISRYAESVSGDQISITYTISLSNPPTALTTKRVSLKIANASVWDVLLKLCTVSGWSFAPQGLGLNFADNQTLFTPARP